MDDELFEVEELTAEMIVHALRGLGLHYFTSQSGDTFIVLLNGTAGSSQTMSVRMLDDGLGLGIELRSGRLFPPDDWPRLLALVNRWHCEHRRPSPRVEFLPEVSGPWAFVGCSTELPCPYGIDLETLSRFVEFSIESTFACWTWLVEQLAAGVEEHAFVGVDVTQPLFEPPE